jgi:type IV pilus assembly protein PilM
MAIQSGVWGVDLGQCALKAVRLEVIDGVVTATAFDYVEHSKILSQPDADADQLIREALDKFLSRNTLKGDQVAISVPGQSGLARFVKLPPVEEKKIGDIVRFEAKQQIPFNLEEVVWDYQKIGSGIVTDGFAMETEIGLFAMKRDMVGRYMQHFKDVNVEVHLVQMAPLALCNFVSYDLLQKGADGSGPPAEEGEKPAGGKKKCVVALDIGADSSNLIITDAERIIWQRPIPLGGNHFTRALTKDLKLTFAKAEHLKRNATKSPDLKKILASLKPVLNDFVGEVQRSLGYFTNTHRDAQIEYMVGLGNAFRLPGLQRFLGEKLQLDVRKLQKMERLAGDTVITAPTFTENVPSLAVAYGLALQGIKQARLQTNLLPPELQVERLVRAKKPMAVAAAAALLLGVGALGLGYAMDLKAFGSASQPPDKEHPVEKAKIDADNLSKEKARLQSAYDDQLKKVEAEKNEVRSLVAGKDERLNWIELNKFISDCIPRVRVDDKGAANFDDKSASNLSEKARAEYWNDAVARAHKKLQDRLAGPKGPLGKDDIDKSYGLLMLFNITGVDCRWTGSMKKTMEGLTLDQDAKTFSRGGPTAPDEPGWIVELRGYTYNNGKTRFIDATLVQNIADLAGIKAAPAAGAGDQRGGAQAQQSTDAKQGDKPTDKPTDKIDNPVRGQIPLVMLYKTKVVPADDGLSLANTGELDSMSLGGAGAGGMRGGGAGEGSGSSRGAGSSPPAGSSSPPGGIGGMRGGSGGGWTPLGTRPRAVGSPPPRTASKGDGKSKSGADKVVKPERTEFVVVFFWREPTKSDSLMGFNAKRSDSSGGQGGGFGGAGGGGNMGGSTPPGGNMGGSTPTGGNRGG